MAPLATTKTRVLSERREQQPQDDHRSEVVDETGPKNAFAKPGLVESRLHHDRVHNRHRRGGQRNPTEETGLCVPAEQIVRYGCTAKEWGEEADKPNDAYLLDLCPEHGRLKFCAGKKRQQYGSGRGEKSEPLHAGPKVIPHP